MHYFGDIYKILAFTKTYTFTLKFFKGRRRGSMSTNTKSKVIYKAPVVLAATKKGSNFSAGCATKGGMTCVSCRCS